MDPIAKIQFEATLDTVQVRGVSPISQGGFSKTDVALPNGVTLNFSAFHRTNGFEDIESHITRFARRSYSGAVRFKITIEEIA